MEQFAFVFTLCFVLLGPIRLIVPFARQTKGRSPAFQRSAATWAALLASATCLFVVLVGRTLVAKYGLSVPALQLTAGLVLLLSALGTIFPSGNLPASAREGGSPLQLAISTLTVPTMIPPVGVAALLIFVMIGPMSAERLLVLATALGVIMLLNFLVMFFNDRVLRIPGLLPGLHLLGGVLIVIQVALAIDTMLIAFRTLGVVAA